MRDMSRNFQPTTAVELPNSRRLIRIERDGSLTDLVRLYVLNSRERELIILLHYLRQYIPQVYKKSRGINILSRDSPWDFIVEVEGGDRICVEITAISDNRQLFEVEGAARELSAASVAEHLPAHKLKRLASLYPFRINREAGDSLDENPYFGKYFLTVSRLPEPGRSYGEILAAAIQSKVQKPHPGKEEIVLIIDDQTTAFSEHEIRSALASLEATWPFKAVWIYIGYGGTADGAAQYTLIELRPQDGACANDRPASSTPNVD